MKLVQCCPSIVGFSSNKINVLQHIKDLYSTIVLAPRAVDAMNTVSQFIFFSNSTTIILKWQKLKLGYYILNIISYVKVSPFFSIWTYLYCSNFTICDFFSDRFLYNINICCCKNWPVERWQKNSENFTPVINTQYTV